MLPSICPEQPCPPRDAADCTGRVYHLVGSDPLTISGRAADCRTRAEKQAPKPCSRCQEFGLSVFPTHDEAVEQFRINSAWMGVRAAAIWKHVAVAELASEHGRIKVTGGSVAGHCTWWPADNLDVPARCGLFTVVGPTPSFGE